MTIDNGLHHPLWVLYLLGLFMTPDQLDSFLGDLEEIFVANLAEYGERRARRYYRFQVLVSTASFLKARIADSAVMRTLGLLHQLIEFVRKLGP